MMAASLSLTLAPTMGGLPLAAADMRAFLAQHAVHADTVYVADLLLEEVLSNVVRHAGAHGTTIGLGVCVDAEAVELLVRDRGDAFDPTTAPLAEPGEARADGRSGGFGLRLVRQFASRLDYERVDGENRLCVRIARRG